MPGGIYLKFEVDGQSLKRLNGALKALAADDAPFLKAAMEEFDITTRLRVAAFMAQILHESGLLRYPVELWGPTESQRRYEVRQDIGNSQPGDGFRFRGRGWIQTTGRANYQRTGEALGVDLIMQPELVATPQYAALTAGWFWNTHKLNQYADSQDYKTMTKKINGGFIGLEDRIKHINHALSVLT